MEIKYDVVEAWLNNVAYSHSNSEGTKYLYTHNFDKFCKFIGKKPEEILEDYENIDEKKFKRRYAQHLRAFTSKLSTEYCVKTVNSVVDAVRSFFKYNRIGLIEFWEKHQSRYTIIKCDLSDSCFAIVF